MKSVHSEASIVKNEVRPARWLPVKFLSCKHKKPKFHPQRPCLKAWRSGPACEPSTGEVETGTSLSFLASPSLTSELWTSDPT